MLQIWNSKILHYIKAGYTPCAIFYLFYLIIPLMKFLVVTGLKKMLGVSKFSLSFGDILSFH